MNKKIIPDNLIPELPKNFWLKIGQDLALLIYNDALEGTMQNDRSMFHYSKQYARYKANNMRRLTKGGTLKYFDPSLSKGKRLYGERIKIKANKLGIRKGLRIGGTSGIQVVNNNIAFVNMELTGKTFRGLLKSPQAIENGVKIGYDAIDGDKVIGNKKRGYDILNIRKKNLEILTEVIEDKVMDKVAEVWSDTVNLSLQL